MPLTVSRSNSTGLNSTWSRSSFPASILEKSSTSLITESSESAESFTRRRHSRLILLQFRAEEQIRHTDDAVHGGADLVADVGQKLALEPGGLLRFVEQPLDFHLLLLHHLLFPLRAQFLLHHLLLLQGEFAGAFLDRALECGLPVENAADAPRPDQPAQPIAAGQRRLPRTTSLTTRAAGCGRKSLPA